VGVENSENAQRSLSYCKEKYQLAPEIVTVDFSPGLIEAVRLIFGEKVIQIDGFHVMQELNTGIRRDLLNYRNKLFRDEISELSTLRCWTGQLQREVETTGTCSKTLLKSCPSIKEDHSIGQQCLLLTRRVLRLIRLENPSTFQNGLSRLLSQCESEIAAKYHLFGNWISEKLPKRQLTVKGMKRLKLELLKKLKKYYRQFRFILETESSEFYKYHWVLFFQPERLTPKREQRLNEFLAKYPSLREYREMTLLVGEIYRKSIHDIDGHQIDDLVIKSYYSQKLQTAIRTIKKFKTAILRFVDAFKANPSLKKSCRANMEHFNFRFKAPFQKGLNRTSQKTLQAKLQVQLGCEVRFFTKEGATA